MLKIQEQIDRIIDIGEGARRQVIVRFGARDKQERQLARLAASAISQRNMSISARDVLPARKKKSGKSSTRGDSGIPPDTLGVSVSLEKKMLGLTNMKELREFAWARMDPALSRELIVKAAGEVVRPKKEKGTVQSFWTSKSMLLDMSKDDLAKLHKAIPDIQAVYPNRTLRIPRLVATKSIPIPIRENRISSWGLQKIGALATWGAYGSRGKAIRVGVLDTGVDDKHPDLREKVVAWAEFDEEGKRVPNSRPHDSDQHGTHCCGVIAGGNQSGQWIGVAPDAELAVALVLNGDQGGTDAQILAGIDWLVEQNVHVISMSLGGLTMDPETPSTYTEAILTCLRAGIPVVTAIGNEGSQTTSSPGNDLFAFSVGATDYSDRAAGFSGGRTQILLSSPFIPEEDLPLPYSKPEVSAPGVAVQSSVPGGKYEAFNGTSMATPHVAGAIALLLSNTSLLKDTLPNKRGFVIQDLLTGSVEELGESGQNHRFGFGRIDVLRAIGFARELGY